MNKTIKTILIVAGLALLIYGGYELVTPEASVDIGIAEFESQNNDNAYISIGIGLVALVAGFIVSKK
ncbi:hypothetical protein C7447_102635 [Tenacibaculum adriaticum]|uniref:Uncharacterized protein n=1 Tax=Tenacibaculum adriaticum TaxID=413713 RepID=A0A5S5DTN8_9FLAO|nr:hypothetical protein [Tenacibaculum adriaticum]TYP99313.1 hypothetical protein C7447_102635 [Tenacibaculum adriaticum]